MTRLRAMFALALLLDVIGAGGALLVSLRTWQTVSTPQPSRTDVLDLTGRTVDSASTALGLAALAGVVAVLATRGLPRRIVGAVTALAGAGLVWRAVTASAAVGTGRARSLVEARHRTVSAQGVVPRVVTHDVWPTLSGVAGVVVVLAGALVAWQGHRWQGMSARYEAPPVVDEQQEQTKRATALWTALDRGEDPTR